MTILYNAIIITGKAETPGSILIEDEHIAKIWTEQTEADFYISKHPEAEVVQLDGKMVLAGGIDAHVHFRDPGLTHKADMQTESAAALLGGVTSFIDMPNTTPQTTSEDALTAKLSSAAGRCHANYGFHLGATNTNFHTILKDLDTDPDEINEKYAAIKVFMGSSTGNMLVDDPVALNTLFNQTKKVVMVHCEDEAIIKENLNAAVEKYGEDIPFRQHPEIRSRKACMKSSMKALELAMQYGTHLHLCHISTKEEMEMVRAAKIHNPNITAETSINYLWFCDEDYERLGSKIKCNPAVKTAADRDAIREALANGVLDTIGTDHAPHLESEKNKPYRTSPSGIPSIQQTLPVLLTLHNELDIPMTRIASVFSEKPAEIFGIQQRGMLKEGNFADLVVVDEKAETIIQKEDLAYKCGWTPYVGEKMTGKVVAVYVNGHLAANEGHVVDACYGKQLTY